MKILSVLSNSWSVSRSPSVPQEARLSQRLTHLAMTSSGNVSSWRLLPGTAGEQAPWPTFCAVSLILVTGDRSQPGLMQKRLLSLLDWSHPRSPDCLFVALLLVLLTTNYLSSVDTWTFLSPISRCIPRSSRTTLKPVIWSSF